MKRKLRRVLLTVCISVLSLIVGGISLVSCGKKQEELKIVFNEQPYNYEIGGVADAYDFIQTQEDVDYEFSFTYLTVADNGETVSTVAQELGGTTIYLAEASRYTLYVTATRGEESLSDSTEFDVTASTPVLLPPSMSLVYELGSSARLNVLLDKASPTTIPASCDIVIDYYTFQENQAPTLESSVNTNPKTRTEVAANESMKKIEFDKRGVYEFHMIAYNGDKTAEASFKVKVLPDQTATVDGVSAYKNAEFGQTENGEVDSSVIRLTGASDIEKASYAVLEDEFVAGQVARFEFYGQNMPSYIGLLNQDEEGATSPNSLTSGYGYTLTTEYSNPAVRVYGFLRRRKGTAALKTSKEVYEIEHFGFADLDPEKHYFFEVAVKKTGTVSYKDSTLLNKDGTPNVKWKYGCGDDQAMIERVKDQYVQNLSLHFSLYEVLEDGSYAIVKHSSVDYLEKSIGGSWFREGEEIVGKLVAYSSISKDVTFKYYKDTLIDNDTFDSSEIEYDEDTKVLSWEAVEGAVNYVVTTSKISSDRYAVLPATTTSMDMSAAFERMEWYDVLDVSVYASIGNNTFSDCKYEYTIKKNPAGMESVRVFGEVTGYDVDANTLGVSLAGAHANSASDFQREVGYVAFEEEYTLNNNGTYVDVYFTGNNMPQVEFFATDVLANVQNVDGATSQGFVVTNGHARNAAYLETSMGGYGYYSNYALFYKYGVTTYDRLTSGNALGGATYANVDGTYTYTNTKNEEKSHNYSNFSMYSLMKAQSEGQEWKYTVGMFKDPTGGVWIDAKLYKVNGNTKDLFASWLSSVIIKAEVKEVKDENQNVITPAAPAQTVLNDGQTISGKIVLHAAFKGTEENSGENFYTKFTCSKPYTGTAATIPLVNGGTYDENTGEVTLNGGVYNKSSGYTTDSGYFAFQDVNSVDGKYTLDENGTYVDFYFTGNNMPNVEFFGSSISGNMFKDNVNTGYVVTNGNGPATLYRNYNAVKTSNLWNTDLTGAYVENGTNNTLAYNPNSFKYNGVSNYKAFFKYGVSDYNKYLQDNYLACDESKTFNYTYYKNSVWTTDTSMTYSDFSMYALMADETQAWKYTVGMYLGADNKVYLDAKLYKAGETTAFASYNAEVEMLETGVVRSGYIVAHAALKGTAQYGSSFYTTFTYTAPYAGDASARA